MAAVGDYPVKLVRKCRSQIYPAPVGNLLQARPVSHQGSMIGAHRIRSCHWSLEGGVGPRLGNERGPTVSTCRWPRPGGKEFAAPNNGRAATRCH